MYSNYEQRKWHKIQQQELMENSKDISSYTIPSLIVALSSLVIGGILIF